MSPAPAPYTRLSFPSALSVGADGLVYVVDLRHSRIAVYDGKGTFVRAIAAPPGAPDGAYTSVDATSAGVYATTAGRIVVMDSSGVVSAGFGSQGAGPGQLDHPNGIAVGEDRIYVADSNNSRVSAFTGAGVPLWSTKPVGGRGSGGATSPTGPAKKGIDLPRGVAVEPDGTLLTCDAFAGQVVRIGRDGRILGRFGQQGPLPGQFNYPNAVAVRGAHILVADKENDRVQVVLLVGK